MNTLVQGYLASTNEFQSSRLSNSVLSEANHVDFGHKLKPGFDGYDAVPEEKNSKEVCSSPSSSSSSSSSSDQCLKETDHSDALMKFISDMLMEEEDELENMPCMLHECLALQATERSLYDALTQGGSGESSESSLNSYMGDSESLIDSFEAPICSSKGTISGEHQVPPSSTRVKKNRDREDSDFTEEQRSNKQLADNVGEIEPLEMYDHVLLCSNSDRLMQTSSGETEQSKAKEAHQHNQAKGKSSRGRPRGRGKKQVIVTKEFVDLRGLLMQCAQAVASFDSRAVDDLLLRIRQHSSPKGDSTERVAHYFANALEARMAGTGTTLFTALSSTRISSADVLKAYKMFITACPFNKTSNLLANRTIGKLAAGAPTLHIIDFGILYGFQWPCLIHVLSGRPGGPPKLRITGIDFPQPGFRPAERVKDTGRRLAKYCKRFGVSFEYNAVAKKWDTVTVEDLKIEKDEVLVVNSMARLHNLPDETVSVNNPRDIVLKLIKKINPDMFIYGVSNGTYNMPFFATRFREALFHFSSVFDMFDATVPQEDENRLLFEKHIFGNEVMNVIACEGTERVERPETYKQWQIRNVRVGFKQVPLDQEIVKYVRSKVKAEYHKDFSVDEDGKWMLQGWKGRVIHAISCWQPARN